MISNECNLCNTPILVPNRSSFSRLNSISYLFHKIIKNTPKCRWAVRGNAARDYVILHEGKLLSCLYGQSADKRRRDLLCVRVASCEI